MIWPIHLSGYCKAPKKNFITFQVPNSMVNSRGQWWRIVFLDGGKFSEGASLRISWAAGRPRGASHRLFRRKKVADYNVSILVAEEI